MANPLTIAQIAEAAGVSTATVDRVLNERPGVNPTTVGRVREAIMALGGGSPTRGRPRTSSNYRFAFVLPAERRGFFDQVDRVIAQTAGEFRHQRITEITHRLPAADVNQFAAALAKLVDLDGIALLAPDLPPVKLAINELVRAGVHVITLFSDVPGSMRATALGADNRAAGRTAGLLIGNAMPRGSRRTCAVLSPVTRFAAELDRRIGFQQVMEERFPDVSVQRLFELPETDDAACEYVRANLVRRVAADAGGHGVMAGSGAAGEDAPLAAVYNVGPGTFGVARALAELAPVPMLVANDLLEVHRSMLISGALGYVIHQDVYYAISAAGRVLRGLCEGVRGALTIGNPRVEILTAENLS